MQQAQLAHAEAVAVANAVPDVELYGDQVVADELVDPEVLLDEEAQNIDPEAQRTTGAVKQKIDKDKMMKLLRSQIEHLPITPVKVCERSTALSTRACKASVEGAPDTESSACRLLTT
ncbi:hypothetical protein TGRUB_428530 [Toxoplasma gondii RUB]|uniref:Uncharacterized protein n=1 Tax=Toxoplasma gondii RUB TaxID=935652 RepID=A0A086MC57_TOXGO|nr:hypothetical protein TGRUB_428530 [Toxoplasma gondii RUB]